MALLPYMPWHPQDFKASRAVQEMSDLEELAYRRILEECWLAREKGIPADEKSLARAAGMDPRRWRSVRDRVEIELISARNVVTSRRVLEDLSEAFRHKMGPKSEAFRKSQAAVAELLAEFKGLEKAGIETNLFKLRRSEWMGIDSAVPSPSPSKSSYRTPSSLTSQALDGARGKTEEEDEEGSLQDLFPEEENQEAADEERRLVAKLAGCLGPGASESQYHNALATLCHLRRMTKVRDVWLVLNSRITRGKLVDYAHRDEEEARRLVRRTGLTTLAEALRLEKGGNHELNSINSGSDQGASPGLRPLRPGVFSEGRADG